MAEYIDRANLIARIEYYATHTTEGKREHYAYSVVLNEVLNRPAADVVPVVHAKWIHTKTEEDDWGHSFHHWHCPVCGWFEGSNPEGARKYCSGCGAKMGGVVDNA